ncbi:hypothetical protein CPAST_c25900 [Clostridium pasteurianum DSM 525 = ATCC 6013]|uniref:Uncharacterized protein n=1 Tax=Clostridium pasteurianum DSM 525 = ATCC 6013 TaxID=1262449 RepID=A0A0H3J5B4_CLOPA|nr:hypothetical protein [Clostridium pasteurianum]AJA48659.1 hypothetical protein CPAST_c25900 [Clostridium pasteurianum DSM 525 = ATCC 6013]AJA52647.1 hypothetical protein CLPA_c25900 [Clostridium pasteurianum DSM 525 = ATCC 6013]AOZ75887.1 hypothetical protein AQ983_12590 [Clostridium pasteurianum DSM 525 = ATCC 6013]AOZ79683.1 hypothetical protein AQ984_12585 [Clostridium pasteurianum]ELP59959.1 hypothetical protein F502_04967 [Clostridium pasteurianum DSM 525 = ATCC 6013]
MKKKIFIKNDINLGNGIILNNFQKENIDLLINKIEQGNLIILSVKEGSSYVIVQKFSYGYEMDVIGDKSCNSDNTWVQMKHDNHSLRVALKVIYQTPEIRDTKFYLYKYNEENITETYMKIIDLLLKQINKTSLLKSI